MATLTQADTDQLLITLVGDVNIVKVTELGGNRRVFIDLRADPDATVSIDVDGSSTDYTIADTDSLTYDIGNSNICNFEHTVDGCRFTLNFVGQTATVETSETEADITLEVDDAPLVTGTLDIGDTLTVTPGTYLGNDVGTPTYRWFQANDDAGAGAAVISSETDDTYVIGVAAGKYIAVEETVTEEGGSNPETLVTVSEYVGPVTTP